MFTNRETAYRLEMGHAMRSAYYTAAHGKLKPEVQAETVRMGGGVVIYASPGSPLNRAIGFGFSDESPEPIIDQVEDFFRQHDAPASFDVSPLAERGFIKELNRRGYRLDKFFSVVACSLAGPLAPLPTAQEVVVQRATPEQAELWIYTTAQGFDDAEVPSEEELEMIAPNFYSQNAHCYLAWIDGQPAGGGGMYPYQGVVELGGASTRPAFRRRGVQTALLLQRLQDAQAGGNDLALATTRPGSDSQRNIERLGFRLAYTKAVLKAYRPA